METFTPKTFNIGELKGISAQNIEEHLKLYKGYVSNSNMILNKIKELEADNDNAYMIAELKRRFAFEFDGMRNHECYFSELENGSKEISADSALYAEIEKSYGSFDKFMEKFKSLAMTRGVGWAMLYYDKQSDNLLTQWVDEQHLGHLAGLSPVLALDMWEHAFVYDYPTSEKKKYVEAFFENLNWEIVEENFKHLK